MLCLSSFPARCNNLRSSITLGIEQYTDLLPRDHQMTAPSEIEGDEKSIAIVIILTFIPCEAVTRQPSLWRVNWCLTLRQRGIAAEISSFTQKVHQQTPQILTLFTSNSPPSLPANHHTDHLSPPPSPATPPPHHRQATSLINLSRENKSEGLKQQEI